MEYIATETSNQFVQAGFGEGTYGPETLVIIFKPAKWQEKKGLPGSTYHYAVPTNIYQRMMAAKDIDAYFNDTIKAHPEQYPYTKMEADATDDIPIRSTFIPADRVAEFAADEPKVTFKVSDDAPAPVTSLAVIDTLENSALFASGGVTDAQLAAGREWYLANAPKGIETEEKRTALKRFARPLQKLRTGIEARAKEFTGETKRKLAAIDTEKRRLVLLVGGIEDEVLRPLTEWEQEEEARKVRLAGIQNELAAKGQRVYMDMAELEKTIAELEAFDVSTMQEYKVGAESAIAASLRVLKPELERRREADANARELEKLRAESAERKRKDEIAEEAKRLAEKMVAEAKPAEAQPYIPTPSEERGTPVTGFHSPAAVQSTQEYAAMEARAADKDHRTKVNYDAAGALVAECQINEPAAYVVIEAIAKGLIPHVTIAY